MRRVCWTSSSGFRRRCGRTGMASLKRGASSGVALVQRAGERRQSDAIATLLATLAATLYQTDRAVRQTVRLTEQTDITVSLLSALARAREGQRVKDRVRLGTCCLLHPATLRQRLLDSGRA